MRKPLPQKVLAFLTGNQKFSNLDFAENGNNTYLLIIDNTTT